MANFWPTQGIDLEFFSPHEFDHPELMDGNFLRDLDTLRMRCGFGLRINDDARTREDLERIYAKEIAKGQSYPSESSHVEVPDVLVRAADLEPIWNADDGRTLDEMELDLLEEILRFRKEGRWPHLGLGCETGHFHIDDTPRLGPKRPAYWVAVSR